MGPTLKEEIKLILDKTAKKYGLSHFSTRGYTEDCASLLAKRHHLKWQPAQPLPKEDGWYLWSTNTEPSLGTALMIGIFPQTKHEICVRGWLAGPLQIPSLTLGRKVGIDEIWECPHIGCGYLNTISQAEKGSSYECNGCGKEFYLT